MTQDPTKSISQSLPGKKAEVRNRLYESDLEIIRVLEDLIDVLIGKGVIVLTDLPEAAQAKLAERRNLRSHLSDLGSIVTEQDDIALP
jgi:hypothetical protein